MGQSIRLGINGFGRIGRKVFRIAWETPGVEIVSINDPSPVKTLAHLLKRDSVHGYFSPNVETDGNQLVVTNSNQTWKIPLFQTRDPKETKWGDHGVDILMECTGKFRDRKSSDIHLANGTKKVIISAPANDPDATICVGVNERDLKPEHQMISNASCTTNCLAPLVKVLDQNFGIECGTMVTIHSYTNDQKILDLGHRDLRRARACAVNMIPTSTGAAVAVGSVWPSVRGKLDGFAVRVPTPNVSLVDLTVNLKKFPSVDEINLAFRKASESELKGILGYSEEPLVSSDFNGSLLSSVLDAPSTMTVDGKLAKVLSWYDNESGFSARMLDLAKLVGKLGFA